MRAGLRGGGSVADPHAAHLERRVHADSSIASAETGGRGDPRACGGCVEEARHQPAPLPRHLRRDGGGLHGDEQRFREVLQRRRGGSVRVRSRRRKWPPQRRHGRRRPASLRPRHLGWCAYVARDRGGLEYARLHLQPVQSDRLARRVWSSLGAGEPSPGGLAGRSRLCPHRQVHQAGLPRQPGHGRAAQQRDSVRFGAERSRARNTGTGRERCAHRRSPHGAPDGGGSRLHQPDRRFAARNGPRPALRREGKSRLHPVPDRQPSSRCVEGLLHLACCQGRQRRDAPVEAGRRGRRLPTYQLIANNLAKQRQAGHGGFHNICVHKGLAHGLPATPQNGFPSDLPKACRDWPQLNFVTYHSCIQDSFFDFLALQAIRETEAGTRPLMNGVPNIDWVTPFAVLTAPFKNSFAEIGTTFASSVVTFPTVTAHILGQLMKFKGHNQILFGSDSVWYGAPQWQLEALWRFQIPEAIREKWGYPKLTEAAKRKILGLNAARIYELPVGTVRTNADPGGFGGTEDEGKYRPVPANFEQLIPDNLKVLLEFPPNPQNLLPDNLSKVKDRYLAMGVEPTRTRYGWVRVRR